MAAVVLAAASCCGCAGAPASGQPHAAEIRCPPGETLSCVERLGEPVRCSCADRRTLGSLLEPDGGR